MLKPNVKLGSIRKQLLVAMCVLQAMLTSNIANSQMMSDFMAQPPGLDVNAAPAVMLVMSRDNQLWHKAYNDYSDLDGDGVIDRSYKDDFEYYGNFNSDWCYFYSSGVFVPAAEVDLPSDHTIHTCSDTPSGAGGWSGNFLNWITTTRLDIVRRVLYGGFRVSDPQNFGRTILQGTTIPDDIHAFVKVVRNSDLNQVRDGLTIEDLTPISLPDGEDAVSFCNVTDWNDDSMNGVSKRIESQRTSPRIKIALGEQITWAGSEKQQCKYAYDDDDEGHADFSPRRPDSITGFNGDQGEMIVRIAACMEEVAAGVPGDAFDADVCRVYSTENGVKSYKPYGLLQQYGETGRLRFGLMTGSYNSNLDGAVLRKKVSFIGGEEANLSDLEIDPSNGEFIDGGIIETLNSLRIAEWNFGGNEYEDCDELGITENEVEYRTGHTCRDWGNPIGEIYAEAVRYFQNPFGGPSHPLSTTNDSDIFTGGLPIDSWPNSGTPSDDPFHGEGACANCAIVVLSSGLNDFDLDLAGINESSSIFNAQAVESATNRIGVLENITGSAGERGDNMYIVGNSDVTQNNQCTGKYIGRLSNAYGSCPQAPTKKAGYKVSGAAYVAHTNDFRPNNSLYPKEQNVDTYALVLSEPLPTFEIPVTTRYENVAEDDQAPDWQPVQESVSFVPTCHSNVNYYAIPDEYLVNDLSGVSSDEWYWNQCSLGQITVVEQSESYGRYLIAWEDALWGFDNDQDAYVSIEYCVNHADNTATPEIEGNEDLSQCRDFTDQGDPNYHHDRDDMPDLLDDGHDWNGHHLPIYEFFKRYETRPNWRRMSEPGVMIRISLLASSADSAIKFGYVINGAGEMDGVYDSQLIRYGYYNFHSSALKGNHESRVIWDAGYHAVRKYADGTVNGDVQDVLTSYDINGQNDPLRAKAPLHFTPGGGAPQYLKDPLWYAVKYGNFNDNNENGVPDDGEWDADGDGNPDGFFPIKNPSIIRDALGGIFNAISSKSVSGTSASINMQTSKGDGAVYQALFTPRIRTQNNASSTSDVRWTGSLFGLFIDSEGRIRSDDDGDATLDHNSDQILTYQSDDGNLVINAIDPSTGDTRAFSLTDSAFNPIWSAEEELDQQVLNAEGRVGNSPDSESITVEYNRSSYTTNAENGRYIFTSINRDLDAVEGHPMAHYVVAPKSGSSLDVVGDNPGQAAATGEDVLFEFNRSNFSIDATGDHRYFDIERSDEQAEVNKLVDYIGGVEKEDFRSRTISNGFSRGTRYLLGDIISSSPITVGRPSEAYDTYYKDSSYAAYKEAYKYRRNVVYVGANDGMLHAFNAGFFDAQNVRFTTTSSATAAVEVSHPLGAELWAYVPFNLLPHLKWLANPNYAHVYFMDGPVQSFDVKLWAENDTVHVGGWGTIIVAGMHFGGGEYSLDHDGDSGTADQTLRSAYVVMDVTNPEQAPKLIAEITHPSLGYSTSIPTIMKEVAYDAEGRVTTSEWHLVFGSGPKGDDSESKRRALVEGISYSTANLFTYDLKRHRLVESILEASPGSEQREEYTYVGGFTAADWDEDFSDDVVYFGLVSHNPNATDANLFGGKIKRGVIDFSTTGDQFARVNNLFNDQSESLPFTSKPYIFKDRVTGERWIYSGTGRYLSHDDNYSRQQQSYFGLKEPKNETSGQWEYNSSVPVNELMDTTYIEVYEDGRILENGGSVALGDDCQTTTDNPDSAMFEDLQAFIHTDCLGWKFDFFTQESGAPRVVNPEMKNIMPPVAADSSLLIGAFDPEADQCSVSATGYLFAPHRSVGVPAPYAALGTDPNRTLPATGNQEQDQEMVLMGSLLGDGIPSITDITVKTVSEEDGDNPCSDKVALGQNSTGEIVGVEINCEPFPAGRRGWAEIPVTW